MATTILTADTHDNLIQAYAVSGSTDNGLTWSTWYDVAGWGGGCIQRTVLADGSLAGPDFYLYPDPPGQARSFTGHYDRFANASRTFHREAFAVRVEGLPRDVRIHGEGGKWGKHWPADFIFFGSCVQVGDELVTATHLVFEGDSRYTQVALSSPDEGRTWHFRSIVAASDSASDAAEGPNESCLIQLEDGDLMCVMRTGRSLDTSKRNVRAGLLAAYSSDGGFTWRHERLPVPGVAPCVRRLSNRLLAISTGRPGLNFWVSDHPRGEKWASIDLLAHHNAQLGPEHQILLGGAGFDGDESDQTTAYTEFVEIAPNRLLLTYDRIPFGWKGVPPGSPERNRMYVMEIELDRD